MKVLLASRLRFVLLLLSMVGVEAVGVDGALGDDAGVLFLGGIVDGESDDDC